MGTRCNVVINYEETKINLYRHWDGYYSETGYDLAVRLHHSFNKIGNANAESFLIVYLMHKEASAFTIWTRSNMNSLLSFMEILNICMSLLSTAIILKVVGVTYNIGSTIKVGLLVMKPK